MATVPNSSSFVSATDWNQFLGEVLPQQGCWTEEKYLLLTDHSNRLIEFTDGFLEALPVPTASHQTILAFLYRTFSDFIEARGGWVLFAPVRLRIRQDKYREPDLLALLSADDPRGQDSFWTGADVALEVVSPDNAERDVVEKRLDYAEGGVGEYWLVDPKAETITVLRLAGGAYVEAGCYRRGDRSASVVVPGLKVDVSTVFDAARPRRS
jgi:Uma2 family endonuclease